MKKLMILVISFIFMTTSVLSVHAAEGKVTYDGNAQEFIFEPGSEHSLTDLFVAFKDVMPGDSLTQKITVKNDALQNVKVKIYIRSLGAHEDSAEFLSQLRLQVKRSEENEMAYMFDAAVNETAQLIEWVCLGTLYSGGEVDLDVTLTVPVELDNEFQNKIGYLDWEFKVEEFPVEPEDPKPPQTGDDSNVKLWFVAVCSSMFLLRLLWIWRKKEKRGSKA